EPGRPEKLGRRRPALGREHVHRSRLRRLADRGTVSGRDGETAREHEEPERLRHRVPAVLGAAAAAGHDVDGTKKSVMRRRSMRGSRAGRLLLAPLAAWTLFGSAAAQTRFTYSSGQIVSPAYEGWRYDADGSLTMVFG